MGNHRDEDSPLDAGGDSLRFHIPQPNRDPQSNWEVDLAKDLEDYLLSICAGEISSHQETALNSINFSEAALLLQGSVQVYSRKVEYLYSLVLAALEFLLQKRQDQQEKPSAEPDGSHSNSATEDDNDNANDFFLGLDDVPVEAKNCLDWRLDKDDTSNHFLKPPANLLVLEGDCLDSSGDAGELESYLLATCNSYRDFLLLDPCDAVAVCSFLNSNVVGQEQHELHKGSSVRSKNRHVSFVSPTRRSGGTANKSGLGRNQGVSLDDHTENFSPFENINDNQWFGPHNHPAYESHQEEPNFGCSNDRDDSDSDSDDPWKPLNPHEPGNLKIKPHRRIKPFGRRADGNSKQNTVASEFPIAKVDSLFSLDLARESSSQSPPFFEKLRRSFTNGEETFDVFDGIDDGNDDNGGLDDLPDDEQTEFDLPNGTYNMDTRLSPKHGKNIDETTEFDGFPEDDPSSQASLEDLCRSHLDALLASIAETEKQTELAARVSTWKQRIEQTLEEQETHPPFDIHQYGDRVLDKLSSEADSGGTMSFTDVVKGQPKHDVARTFSALLQLVNNGDVDLQRAPACSELICYTAANPFSLKLLRSGRRKEFTLGSQRKRMKSPLKNPCGSKANPSTSEPTSPVRPSPSHQKGKLPAKNGKGSATRCTPEGKRRRRSRLAAIGNLQPAG